MGLDLFSGIGLAISAIGTASQIISGNKTARDQARAIAANQEYVNNALTVQQQQAIEQSDQEKSDRAKEADRQLSSLRVISGEAGGLGTVNYTRQAGEIASFEGIDIARIEANRDRTIQSLQSQKEGGAITARSQLREVSSRSSQSTVGAVFGGLGSGLQIVADQRRRDAYKDYARKNV